MYIAYGMNKDGKRDYMRGQTYKECLDWAKENLDPYTYIVEVVVSNNEYEQMKRTCLLYKEMKVALNKLFSFLEG